jgi:RNA polymerase sporulation-specific sigma factor
MDFIYFLWNLAAVMERAIRGSDSEAQAQCNQLRLIAAAKLGDHEAFGQLFRIYRSPIYSIASRYFAPGCDHDDFLQEATIGFLKAIRDFQAARGEFSAFARLCVRRQVVTFVKTATRQKHISLNRAASLDAPLWETGESLLGRIPSPQTVVSDSLHGIEFINDLWARCTDLERGVLTRYHQGYTFEEIATEIGVHSKAVDNAIWRVKLKARKLRAQGFSPA